MEELKERPSIDPEKTTGPTKFITRDPAPKQTLSGQTGSIIVVLIVSSLLITAVAAWASRKSPVSVNSRAPIPSVTLIPSLKPTTKPTPTTAVKLPTSTPIKSPTPSPTPQPTSTPPTTVTSTPPPTAIPTTTPDTSPPQITQMTGPEDGGTYTFANFCFRLSVSDTVTNYSSQFLTSYQFNSSIWSPWANELSPCFNNVSAGTHTFSIRVRDAAGNQAPTITRIFTTTQ